MPGAEFAVIGFFLLLKSLNLFLEFIEVCAGVIDALVDGCQIVFDDFIAIMLLSSICSCFRTDSLALHG